MILLMVAALAAAAPAADKPDPARDQAAVCTLMVLEKVQSMNEGGEPVSIAVPLYIERAGLTGKAAAEFEHGCDLMEKGFVLALQLTTAKTAAAAAPVESSDEGLAPDHSHDTISQRR